MEQEYEFRYGGETPEIFEEIQEIKNKIRELNIKDAKLAISSQK